MTRTKKIRDYSPEEVMLLPPSLDDWLEPDHPAYFVRKVVEGFDLSAIYGSYDKLRGYRGTEWPGGWEAHHIDADGPAILSNCEILCTTCHKNTGTYGG